MRPDELQDYDEAIKQEKIMKLYDELEIIQNKLKALGESVPAETLVMPKIADAKRWVNTKERQPIEEKYYIVLRSNSNPMYASQCHPAVHFWYAKEKKWSSETEYWLEDIDSNFSA